MRSSAFVSYPIQTVLPITSPGKQEWVINNGYKIMGFLPVSISNYNIHEDYVVDISVDQDTDCQVLSLEDEVRLMSISEGREHNKLVLQNTLKRSIQELELVTVPGFPISYDRSGVWNCFQTVL